MNHNSEYLSFVCHLCFIFQYLFVDFKYQQRFSKIAYCTFKIDHFYDNFDNFYVVLNRMLFALHPKGRLSKTCRFEFVRYQYSCYIYWLLIMKFWLIYHHLCGQFSHDHQSRSSGHHGSHIAIVHWEMSFRTFTSHSSQGCHIHNCEKASFSATPKYEYEHIREKYIT